MTLDPARAAFATFNTIHHHLKRVSKVVPDAEARLLPMKGACMHLEFGPLGYIRPMRDIDLLCAPGSFPAICDDLRRGGFRVRPSGRGEHECTAVRPDLRLPLDVHASPFPHGRFDLSVRGIWQRTRVSAGYPGWRAMGAMDAYANIVGVLTADHLPLTSLVQLTDLAFLAQKGTLDATAMARHLASHGLARAALYVLRHCPLDAFANSVLRELPRDRVAEKLVAGMDLAVAYGGPGSLPGQLGAFALERNLLTSARATWLAAGRLIRANR